MQGRRGRNPPKRLGCNGAPESCRNPLRSRRGGGQGKYFKGQARPGPATFLSLEFLPHFLATQGTAVDASAAEEFYEAGRISRNALELWQALALHGPLPTLETSACLQVGNASRQRTLQEGHAGAAGSAHRHALRRHA